ncbi:hypothetical protein PAHAL_6G289000 [Panicum hallii]|uniref:Uncharacterized protein n=1 Tax=Panicum hallii TaxID=206008 RepID=A0A2S3I4D2_9POAL|nr:hypothetical protein PAHAL_6G289000 [Panicum hallii]
MPVYAGRVTRIPRVSYEAETPGGVGRVGRDGDMLWLGFRPGGLPKGINRWDHPLRSGLLLCLCCVCPRFA